VEYDRSSRTAAGLPALQVSRRARRSVPIGEESPAFTLDRSIVKAMPRVSAKNQVTLPVEAMRAAGLRAGDEVTVRPIGDGEVVVAARGSRVRRHAGIASGIYRKGELERLRDEWER